MYVKSLSIFILTLLSLFSNQAYSANYYITGYEDILVGGAQSPFGTTVTFQGYGEVTTTGGYWTDGGLYDGPDYVPEQFSNITFSTTIQITHTALGTPPPVAQVVRDEYFDTSFNGISEIRSCTGYALTCDSVVIGTSEQRPIYIFNPGDLSVINWVVVTYEDTPLGQSEIVSYYTATAVIPVPTAAWLFGSALLGLVGLKRNKS